MKLYVSCFLSMFFVTIQSSDSLSAKLIEPLKFSVHCLAVFEESEKQKSLDTLCCCEGGPVGCVLKHMVPRFIDQKDQNLYVCCARTTCACCIAYPCYFLCCYSCCTKFKKLEEMK